MTKPTAATVRISAAPLQPRGWILTAPDHPTVPAARVSSFAEIDAAAHALAVTAADAAPSAVRVDLHVNAGALDVLAARAELASARAHAETAAALAHAATARLVRQLRDAGLTQADIAAIANLSHQRVSQLLAAQDPQEETSP